jgi:hypothetical protein
MKKLLGERTGKLCEIFFLIANFDLEIRKILSASEYSHPKNPTHYSAYDMNFSTLLFSDLFISVPKKTLKPLQKRGKTSFCNKKLKCKLFSYCKLVNKQISISEKLAVNFQNLRTKLFKF